MTSNAKRTPPASGFTTIGPRASKSVPPAGTANAGALKGSAWTQAGRVGSLDDFSARRKGGSK